MEFSIHLFIKHFWKHLFQPEVLNISSIVVYNEESDESEIDISDIE